MHGSDGTDAKMIKSRYFTRDFYATSCSVAATTVICILYMQCILITTTIIIFWRKV